MHCLSYTKSRCLTYTPTRFDARCRHIQWVPFQLLTSQHINWFSKLCLNRRCRNAVLTRSISFLKFQTTWIGVWKIVHNCWFNEDEMKKVSVYRYVGMMRGLNTVSILPCQMFVNESHVSNLHWWMQWELIKCHSESFTFIVAPCISMIQSLLYTNLCTYIYILSITKTLCSLDRSYMFRHTACHHQGALLSWLKSLVKNIRS
jgi:hypothetical protein